jgi:hypothetical protein
MPVLRKGVFEKTSLNNRIAFCRFRALNFGRFFDDKNGTAAMKYHFRGAAMNQALTGEPCKPPSAERLELG